MLFQLSVSHETGYTAPSASSRCCWPFVSALLHAVAVSQDPVAIIHHAQQPVMMLSILHQTQLEAISASASGPMNVMLYDELLASQVPRRF